MAPKNRFHVEHIHANVSTYTPHVRGNVWATWKRFCDVPKWNTFSKRFHVDAFKTFPRQNVSTSAPPKRFHVKTFPRRHIAKRFHDQTTFNYFQLLWAASTWKRFWGSADVETSEVVACRVDVETVLPAQTFPRQNVSTSNRFHVGPDH